MPYCGNDFFGVEIIEVDTVVKLAVLKFQPLKFNSKIRLMDIANIFTFSLTT